MADIRIVAEVVGANKVNALVNSTKKLEGQVKNLGNAYLSGKIGPEQFNKGLTELRKSANALYPTHQKASAVVTKLARDYITLTKAQQQDIAATKAYVQARREATAINQRFNQEKKLEEMRVKQATQSLRAYTAASQASTIANKGNVKGTNNLGVIMQQTGYQVGDFAVQVQGGTNVAVAFGQQATQLVGALYLLPAPLLAAKVGILGLSISVTALIASFSIILPIVTGVVAYFMRSAEAAKASAREVETLDDKLKSLDNTLREWLRTKQAADLGVTAEQLLGIEGLDEANDRLEEANQRLIRLAASRKAVAQSAGPEGAVIALGVSALNALGFDSGTSDQQQAAIEEYLKALERVGQLQQKLDDEQYKNFAGRYVQLQQEIALEQTRLQFGKDSVQAQNLELEQRILNMQKAIDEQVKANELTENQGELLKTSEENAIRLSAEVEGMKDNLSDAVVEATNLAKALESAANAGTSRQRQIAVLRAKIEAVQSGASTDVAGARAGTAFDIGQAGGSGIVANAAAAIAASEAQTLEQLQNRLSELTKTEGLSGGSATTDPLLGQMEQLEKFLSSERELLLMEYETRQMTLEQSLEKEYITRQQYAGMIVELEGKKNKELTDLEVKTQRAKVSAVAGGIQNVLNAAANGNEKLLKAARVIGAAEALINTYRAAAQTLADPTLPFYAKFAASAAVLASGFGMINAIKSGSQASVSGSASAPSGADAAIPTQATAAPQRVIIEGVTRESLITGEQLSNIFEALYKENENRGFVFEVAR